MTDLVQVLDAGGTLALCVLILGALWRGLPALTRELRDLREMLSRIDERLETTVKLTRRIQRATDPDHLHRTPAEGVPTMIERETTSRRRRTHAEAGEDDD